MVIPWESLRIKDRTHSEDNIERRRVSTTDLTLIFSRYHLVQGSNAMVLPTGLVQWILFVQASWLLLGPKLAFPSTQAHEGSEGYFMPIYGRQKSVPLPVGCQTQFATHKSSVCVPTVSRICEEERVPITRAKIGPKKCEELKIPQCQVVKEEKEIEVCGSSFEQVEEKDEIQSFKVDYAHRCEHFNYTICPYETESNYRHPAHPVYRIYQTNHHCTEELRMKCFQVPFVRPVPVEMTFIFPKAKEDCLNRTIEIASVECEEETEEVCTEIPILEEDEQVVRTCKVVMDPEKNCQYVAFTIPQTICRSRPNPFKTYGHQE